jgi:hypothetical protein
MSTIASLPTARARLEPHTVFDHPRDLVAAVLLTRGQKLAALERWRVHCQLVSPTHTACATIAAIEEAKRTLRDRLPA